MPVLRIRFFHFVVSFAQVVAFIAVTLVACAIHTVQMNQIHQTELFRRAVYNTALLESTQLAANAADSFPLSAHDVAEWMAYHTSQHLTVVTEDVAGRQAMHGFKKADNEELSHLIGAYRSASPSVREDGVRSFIDEAGMCASAASIFSESLRSGVVQEAMCASTSSSGLSFSGLLYAVLVAVSTTFLGEMLDITSRSKPKLSKVILCAPVFPFILMVCAVFTLDGVHRELVDHAFLHETEETIFNVRETASGIASLSGAAGAQFLSAMQKSLDPFARQSLDDGVIYFYRSPMAGVGQPLSAGVVILNSDTEDYEKLIADSPQGRCQVQTGEGRGRLVQCAATLPQLGVNIARQVAVPHTDGLLHACFALGLSLLLITVVFYYVFLPLPKYGASTDNEDEFPWYSPWSKILLVTTMIVATVAMGCACTDTMEGHWGEYQTAQTAISDIRQQCYLTMQSLVQRSSMVTAAISGESAASLDLSFLPSAVTAASAIDRFWDGAKATRDAIPSTTVLDTYISLLPTFLTPTITSAIASFSNGTAAGEVQAALLHDEVAVQFLALSLDYQNYTNRATSRVDSLVSVHDELQTAAVAADIAAMRTASATIYEAAKDTATHPTLEPYYSLFYPNIPVEVSDQFESTSEAGVVLQLMASIDSNLSNVVSQSWGSAFGRYALDDTGVVNSRVVTLTTSVAVVLLALFMAWSVLRGIYFSKAFVRPSFGLHRVWGRSVRTITCTCLLLAASLLVNALVYEETEAHFANTFKAQRQVSSVHSLMSEMVLENVSRCALAWSLGFATMRSDAWRDVSSCSKISSIVWVLSMHTTVETAQRTDNISAATQNFLAEVESLYSEATRAAATYRSTTELPLTASAEYFSSRWTLWESLLHTLQLCDAPQNELVALYAAQLLSTRDSLLSVLSDTPPPNATELFLDAGEKLVNAVSRDCQANISALLDKYVGDLSRAAWWTRSVAYQFNLSDALLHLARLRVAADAVTAAVRVKSEPKPDAFRDNRAIAFWVVVLYGWVSSLLLIVVGRTARETHRIFHHGRFDVEALRPKVDSPKNPVDNTAGGEARNEPRSGAAQVAAQGSSSPTDEEGANTS